MRGGRMYFPMFSFYSFVVRAVSVRGFLREYNISADLISDVSNLTCIAETRILQMNALGIYYMS